jgi:hypothetical protein
MWDKLKGAGAVVGGIAIFLGIALLIALFIHGGAWLGELVLLTVLTFGTRFAGVWAVERDAQRWTSHGQNTAAAPTEALSSH